MADRFDVVIPCGPDRPETLRYALRTMWHHFPYDRVFLVGNVPDWVVNVEIIPVDQNGRRHNNQHRNLTAILNSDVADEFYWWDDDQFLLEPRDSIPSYHDMTLSQWLSNKDTPFTRSGHHAMGEYHLAFRSCMDLLQFLGYSDGLVPTHTPMRISLSQLKHMETLIVQAMLKNKGDVPDLDRVWAVWKAFYLSLIADVSESPYLHDPRWRQGELTMEGFWATNRSTWTGPGGDWIRNHFWRPSPFEQE